ncbi:MAG: ATP-dependent sacrificial sulfur transferase LarE [Syntrophobacterales bacterium]|nr:ATP-dependent sacrificial sulfur transferase LarE [Syntrophobacterales bacterium]
MRNIKEKHRKLRSLLKNTGGLVVAYSGGCDSALLAYVAKETLGSSSLCVLLSSESYPQSETDQALNTAAALGLSVITITESIVADRDFTANTIERCYFCKKRLFARLLEIGRQHSLYFVADGSNRDDSDDYRPGKRASEELGVISPLREAGFTKDDVRKLSRQLNLPTWDKPSLACLASRIPYGTKIDSAILQRIGKAEQLLKERGFNQVRVRHHGDIARIEVETHEIKRLAADENRLDVEREFKKLGYLYVTLDLNGYKTGSMNAALKSL